MSQEKPLEPKQTTPKGVEIPVPKRSAFFKNLKKVVPLAKAETDKPK